MSGFVDQMSSAQATPAPIRILVVDDLAVVRSGLKIFVRAFDDLELVGEAANGDEAVRLSITLPPEMAVWVKAHGTGNASAGVRAAVQQAMDMERA